MRMFTERTQVLLSPEQLARLKRMARREGRSVGAVIRDAVDAYSGGTMDRRQEALERLFALEAPVADWDIMKAEIIEGRYGELPGWEPES
jgi:predicted DNA-binding protein